MLAWTTIPGRPGTGAVQDVPEPALSEGAVLVKTLCVGVCGTDRDILAGQYGKAPQNSDYLVLGHESLGQVVTAPAESGFGTGDLVVGVVRRPDPIPCDNCAAGEWDMCRNGMYTERGIKLRHGYGSERFRVEPEFLVRISNDLSDVGVLLEPTSIVAKAWDQIDGIGLRAPYKPKRALITGAGPVGLLAAMLGVQRGLEVHVLDRVIDGIKPDLVKALGAVYHHGSASEACPGADIVIECTGAGQVVLDAMRSTSPGGIVCLAGISSGTREIRFDVGAFNRSMVLENDVVFGSVNANLKHYKQAADALALADRQWLERIITRRVPLARWSEVLEHDPEHDVKSVITFS